MDILPIEVMELILSFLDQDTLEMASFVCVSWWNIISKRHFYPYLTAQEYSVEKYLARNGWNPSCSDVGLVTKLVRKLKKSTPVTWYSSRTTATVRDKIIDQEYKFNYIVSLVYKDKLYIYKMQRNVDVYSLETLEKIYSLEIEEGDGDYYYFGRLERNDRFGLLCTFPSQEAYLAGRNWWGDQGGDQAWLYNLDTDELVWRTDTKEPFSFLVLNNTMMVGLFESFCRSWIIDSSLPHEVKVELKSNDLFRSTNPTSNSEIKMVTINSKWLVYFLEKETSSGRGTFLVCRLEPGGEMGQIRKLECLTSALDCWCESVSEGCSVSRMLLNDKNLLAVSIAHDYEEHYDLWVIDVSTDTDVAGSSYGLVITWSGDWLFAEEYWTASGTWRNVRTDEAHGIDAFEETRGADRYILPYILRNREVEVARLTEVTTKYIDREREKVNLKVKVYDFWNVSDIAPGDDAASKAKQSRGEKKARKIMSNVKCLM